MNIDNIDNTLTFTSSMNDTEKKLKNIVEDIKDGNINSKTVQNNKKIKEYLNNDKSEEPEPTNIELEENNKNNDNLNKITNTIKKNDSRLIYQSPIMILYLKLNYQI